MLIGFHGKARSGKDTCADYLVDRYGFEKYSFAKPLKDGVMTMLNWTPEHAYGDLKDKVDPTYGFSPRHALQTLGTDWGRKLLRDDIWLLVGEKTISNMDRCVIADVRFDNEAEMIRNNGGMVVHLYCEDSLEVEAHESEAGIMMKSEDYFIDNSYNISDIGNSYSISNLKHNLDVLISHLVNT